MNLAGNFDFVIKPLHRTRGGKEPGIFDHRRGFARQGPQDFPIQIGECARSHMAIEIQHAEQLTLACGDCRIQSFDDRKLVHRDSDHRVQFEPRYAFLLAHSAVFAGIADDQFAASLGHALHHRLGNLHLIGTQGSVLRVARHDHLQFAPFIREQQDPSFGSGHLNGGVHHRGQHVLQRQAGAKRARHFQQNAQMV